MAGGDQLADQADAAELFAGLLADLVRLAPPPSAVPPLVPSPPWVGWDRQAAGLRPEADDLAVDLNRHRGPDWLDQTAARVCMGGATTLLSVSAGALRSSSTPPSGLG